MAKKSKTKSKAKKSVKAKSAAKAKSKKTTKAKPSKKTKVKSKKAKPSKSKKVVSKTKSKSVKKTSTKKKAVKKAKTVAKKKTPAKKTAVKKVKAKKNPAVKKAAPLPKAAAVTETIQISSPVAVDHVFVPHSTSLREGMSAPYFEGRDQHGNTVRSSDFMGKTIILYFYPKDDTPGCTAESCSLRDEYLHLSNSNYAVVGVSADDIDSHQRFAEKYNLPFPLIADTDRAIINAYDVWGPKMLAGNVFDGIVRTTFVIDGDGIIKSVVTKVDTANHAKQLLEL